MTRRRSPLPGLFALFLMCGLVGAFGAWLFLPDLIKVMTARLAPPMYPGVQVVDEVGHVEFGTATEQKTYRVATHVSVVQPWLERRMPGFDTCVGTTPTRANCQTNIVCDSSPISRGLIWLLLGEAGNRSEACVSVMVLPLPGDDRYTLIRYSMSWPAENVFSP
jgi:hypothetical protein